ncbi:MAG: hypothetical protein N2657_03900 [bacterium]|nr:hypothetical protein [bacterium]
MQFEELYYGVLVMVLCYDVWFTYGSMHEAKAYKIRKAKTYKIRKAKSGWFGKSIRQVVEGVISCVKSFNAVGDAIANFSPDVLFLNYLKKNLIF